MLCGPLVRAQPSLLRLKGVTTATPQCKRSLNGRSMQVKASAATLQQASEKRTPDRPPAAPVEAKDVSSFPLHEL